MKERKFLEDTFLNRTIKVLAILIMAAVLLVLLSLFEGVWETMSRTLRIVLVPVALAWLISLILFPIVRYLEKVGLRPRALSVTIVYLLSAAFMAGLLVFLVPLFTDQIRQFFTVDYPAIAHYFQTQFRQDFVLGPELFDFLAEAVASSNVINSVIENFFDSLARLIPSTFYGIAMLVAILPILLLFYLLDYEKVNASLASLIPSKYATGGKELIEHLNTTVGAYIRGQFFLMLAIGTVATMVFKLIGLEYYFIFGMLVGILNIIPYFGALIAMIPVVLYVVFTQQVTVSPFLIIAVSIVLQFIEGNVFQPVIMGKQLEIHPMIIILSILLFGSLFGVLGVVFASPIAATLKVLYGFYKAKQLSKEESISLVKPVE